MHYNMNEQKIISMLLDHEERLTRIEENMATKQDISGIHNAIDAVLKIVMRTEQELIMLGQRVNRHEQRIERLEEFHM